MLSGSVVAARDSREIHVTVEHGSLSGPSLHSSPPMYVRRSDGVPHRLRPLVSIHPSSRRLVALTTARLLRSHYTLPHITGFIHRPAATLHPSLPTHTTIPTAASSAGSPSIPGRSFSPRLPLPCHCHAYIRDTALAFPKSPSATNVRSPTLSDNGLQRLQQRPPRQCAGARQ